MRYRTGRWISTVLAILISASLLLSGCSGDSEAVDQTEAVKQTEISETADVTTTENEVATEASVSETVAADTDIEEEGLAGGSSAVSTSSEARQTAQTEDTYDGYSGMEVTMLDVGQGLSVLIEADGQYMLYDGGGREASSYVVSYIKKHADADLTYVVASHYDEDHIAGLVGVLNTADVGTVICPDYTSDTAIYDSFEEKLEANGAQVDHPDRGDTYTLGHAQITVLSPLNYDQNEDNNNSIAIRVVYGTFSCILTGDAEEEAEKSMIRSGLTLDSDLYIAGHHGSSSSNSQSFLKAISPAAVWISCGAGNAYGHPTEQTLDRIESVGAELFRTDIQGEVTCTSDGKTYSFEEDACTDWTPGTVPEVETKQTSSDSSSDNSSDYTYILNTSTKKFHYPNCKSVKQMKDKNKAYSSESRDQLIAEGYSPCGNCHP